MKKNIFVKGMAAVLVAASLSSCSEDYLQTYPITSVDASTLMTPEGAEAALNGLCRSMYTQYVNLEDYHAVNGESSITMLYGDVFGEDYFSLVWAFRAGRNYMWDTVTNYQSWPPSLGWRYYYNLVNQANTIVESVEASEEGTSDLMQVIKAEAMIIRAHAYVRLMQIYGPRWSDSADGARKCIVLRTKSGNEDEPLATCNQVYDFIYETLDEAIEIMETKGGKRAYMWEPNVDVARGIYARAAMLKNDYKTAEKMAHDARQNYPIMSSDEFVAGFAEPNAEWMWCNAAEVEGIYFWAHGSWYACQGPYPTLWGLGAGCINYDLYKKIPSGDIRATQFFTPDKPLRKPLTPASFWNKDIVNPADMNLAKNANMKISVAAFGKKLVPNGDETKWGLPYIARLEGGEGDIRICFGAQYKFWALDTYGTDSFPYMRGAEMLLTEAEAAYHNGNVSVTKSCLEELNANRNSRYSCTQSGDALLEEVRLQRRIELWGEGHSWFDFKRWGYDLNRRPWISGDVNSNNVPASYSFSKTASDCNGWRFAIPQIETQYNHAIDRTELDY
ncbi:MAG: RagB/SusD family nutrient uptake outer membrane protein [Muribaculaceae bacterium]|nr:RagB/SusD family nutrient uptake outer membrane protein [Muribaculaceae bacterium]